MNKKNILIVLIFVLMLSSVQASFLILEEDVTIFYPGFIGGFVEEQYIASQMYYDTILDSLSAGNISLDAKFKLFSGGNILDDDFERADLLTFSIADLEALNDIYLQTGFFVYSQDEIDEAILNLTNTQDAVFNEYLEYESTKNLFKSNINNMWRYIIAFFRLLFEIISISLYLISLYFMVYVIIEAIPEALIFMRDKMLERAILRSKKRGSKK